MTWTARNNGLTGTALNVNYIIIHPSTKNLVSSNHELYIATDDGIYHSLNGGTSWAKLTLPDPSNAEFADSPAATIDELTFHWIVFSPLNLQVLLALGAKDSVSRIWLYRSVDSGLSWISRGVTTT
jgi:hypothetical protein